MQPAAFIDHKSLATSGKKPDPPRKTVQQTWKMCIYVDSDNHLIALLALEITTESGGHMYLSHTAVYSLHYAHVPLQTALLSFRY